MVIYRDLMVYGNLPTVYSLTIVILASLLSYVIGRFTFSRLQRRFAEEM